MLLDLVEPVEVAELFRDIFGFLQTETQASPKNPDRLDLLSRKSQIHPLARLATTPCRGAVRKRSRCSRHRFRLEQSTSQTENT